MSDKDQEIARLKKLIKHIYENSQDKGVVLHCEICKEIEEVVKENQCTEQ